MSDVRREIPEGMSAQRRKNLGILARFAVEEAQKENYKWLQALCRYDKTVVEALIEAKGLSKELSEEEVRIAAQFWGPMIALTGVPNREAAEALTLAEKEERGRKLACAADALRAAVPLVEEYLELKAQKRCIPLVTC